MTADSQTVLQSWSSPLGLDLVLCLTSLIYARGWLRLRAAFPNLVSPWRLAAFLAGIVSVWIAIGSPLQALDDVSLSIHMIQHLLLMTIAPLFILLAAPTMPLLHGLPHTLASGAVGPFLRWRWVKWFGSFITRPIVAWLIAALTLLLWHIPAVFDSALRLSWLHVFEHVSFFAAGLIFWWPVVQPWPSRSRSPRWIIPLYLFCATLPCDALSGFLVFCDRVIYSSYLSAPRVFAISALEDQQLAAALMWVSVTIILLVPAAMVTIQILSSQGPRLLERNWIEVGEISAGPLPPSKTETV
ncbi:MAG: cytochrome c oxidase assembly protein [Candidatus Acidiferrales bacterium]